MAPEHDLLLLTGGAGWLGQALVAALFDGIPGCPPFQHPRPGQRLRVLLLPGEEAPHLEKWGAAVEIVRGDLRDPTVGGRLCAGARDAVLLHTAGVIHPRWVREYHRVNVVGTENLLQAAAAAGVRRAVVTSSNSPCGCNPHPDHVFDEESPYHPYMGYGRSKMEMERRVRGMNQAGTLDTVIVRPPWFYGPHQPPRQTLFFRMIRDGKGPVVGGGENLRSMVYIENLAQGMLLAAQTPGAAGRTYWIADEAPYTMNQVLDTVERLLEQEFGQPCRHKRLRLPGVAAEVALAVDGTLQALGLYHQKIHVLSEMNKTIACTIERAKTELGYAPTVALEEGMRRSLRWCLDQGLL